MDHNFVSVELSLEDRIAIDTMIDSQLKCYEKKCSPRKKDFWYDRIVSIQNRLKLV